MLYTVHYSFQLPTSRLLHPVDDSQIFSAEECGVMNLILYLRTKPFTYSFTHSSIHPPIPLTRLPLWIYRPFPSLRSVVFASNPQPLRLSYFIPKYPMRKRTTCEIVAVRTLWSRMYAHICACEDHSGIILAHGSHLSCYERPWDMKCEMCHMKIPVD